MNLNTQSLFYPPQPDNPSDYDREFLSKLAFEEKGWPEDFNSIKRSMSPPPQITSIANPGEFKNKKVAVLGGGLAGLSAAFELRKLGFDLTIYEALDDRVGGRVYTYYFDEKEKNYHEFGAMRIPVTHETVWHYLNLFHLPTRPFIQYSENSFVYFRQARARNNRSGSDVMRNIYPKYGLTVNERNTNWQQLQKIALESHLLNASTDSRAEILQVKPQYDARTRLWSDYSSMRLMESAGLSQEAISLISNFAHLLYGNLYNSYIDYIQESYPADLNYLYEIPGGMVKLPEAFIKSLKNPNPTNEYPQLSMNNLGVIKYKAGHWVKGISYDHVKQKVIIKVENSKEKKKWKEEFDYVICALPFSSLRNVEINPLFSALKMRSIREVYYTPASKTLIFTKERFWEKQGIVGGGSYTDLPISSIWYPSDHAKYLTNPSNFTTQLSNMPSNEPGVFVVYNFGLDTTRLTNLPKEMFFTEMKREIEAVHSLPKGYLDSIILDYKTVNWDKEPSFRGALTFYEPEQKRIFSYNMTLPEYNNRVFFAGEHISAVHRWMQGALQSGMKAANDLAITCKMSK